MSLEYQWPNPKAPLVKTSVGGMNLPLSTLPVLGRQLYIGQHWTWVALPYDFIEKHRN